MNAKVLFKRVFFANRLVVKKNSNRSLVYKYKLNFFLFKQASQKKPKNKSYWKNQVQLEKQRENVFKAYFINWFYLRFEWSSSFTLQRKVAYYTSILERNDC